MTDSSQRPQEPNSFAEKIFGINPYSKDDPNHDAWESNARLAAEEEAIFEAELLKRNPVTPEEYARYVQDGMIGHFDILARRLLIVKFRSSESIVMYQELLTGMMESMLTRAGDKCPPMILKAAFIFELGRQYRQRIAHWTAEALKRMREGMATDRISRNADPTGTSRKGHRVRGPDKRKHRERGEFEDALISELAAVRDQQNSAPTLDQLRKRFPAFKLWTILSQTEQEELLAKEFKPKAYARALTARKFGVAEEAIKKSRQTLRRLHDTPNA
jgi:hypothetical protein